MGVPEEEAAFGMLGITALHGIRCANLSFGSHVVVMGVGLIGSAHGANVTGLRL